MEWSQKSRPLKTDETLSFMKEHRVALHGPNGLYVYGTLDEDGEFSLHLSCGGLMRGTVNDCGEVSLRGPDGRYTGKLDSSGTITLHGPGGYLHGRTN